jgi:hypothetical protein
MGGRRTARRRNGQVGVYIFLFLFFSLLLVKITRCELARGVWVLLEGGQGSRS